MKRIVRTGGGMRLAATSVFSVRAISRFAAQPLALYDVAGGSVGAGNGRHQRLVRHRVVVARAHHSVEPDAIAGGEPLLKRTRLAH
jgi:hypothetical protein